MEKKRVTNTVSIYYAKQVCISRWDFTIKAQIRDWGKCNSILQALELFFQTELQNVCMCVRLKSNLSEGIRLAVKERWKGRATVTFTSSAGDTPLLPLCVEVQNIVGNVRTAQCDNNNPPPPKIKRGVLFASRWLPSPFLSPSTPELICSASQFRWKTLLMRGNKQLCLWTRLVCSPPLSPPSPRPYTKKPMERFVYFLIFLFFCVRVIQNLPTLNTYGEGR